MLIDLEDYRRRRAKLQAAMTVLSAQPIRAIPDWGIAACAASAVACAVPEAAPDHAPFPEHELADLFAGATLV